MASSGAHRRQHGHLRVLDAESRGCAATASALPLEHRLPLAREQDHVVVAGADAATRMRMLAELRSLLPEGTRFVEAGETWEVVARAAGSRMVVLAGDLGEMSRGSLLRLLARRNPALPVLAVGSEERSGIDGSARPGSREPWVAKKEGSAGRITAS